MLSSEMPINQPIVVTNADYIHVVATRIDSENILIVYRDPTTWDIVLDLHVTVDGNNSRIAYLDRVFWSLMIEGRPATEHDLNDLEKKGKLNFKVNPQARQIQVAIQQ